MYNDLEAFLLLRILYSIIICVSRVMKAVISRVSPDYIFVLLYTYSADKSYSYYYLLPGFFEKKTGKLKTPVLLSALTSD